jgi:hypothetical protein
MASLTEGQHAGEFVLTELPGHLSRENVVVLSGQNLEAGAVIGRVDKGIGRAVSAAGSNAGNGTLSGLYVSPEVEVGTYTLTCIEEVTNGGVFKVVAPSGKRLRDLTVGVAYTSRHINLTIADGGNDFEEDDTFTIVVSTTAPAVAGTGNGTIGSLALGPDAKPGRYLLTCITEATDGGIFQVIGPDGDRMANATVGVAYVSRQISFTIADGSTDYDVNATFEVVVFNQLSGGKAAAWVPGTYDGRHKASGVLFEAVDASGGDAKGVLIARYAEVRSDDLQWAAATSAADKASAARDLAIQGVLVR